MLRALLDGQGKCEAAFRCRRTTSAVPECVWAPQRQRVVVAVNRRDLDGGCSSWSLLLILPRVPKILLRA